MKDIELKKLALFSKESFEHIHYAPTILKEKLSKFGQSTHLK
jgi:hypothetical protein